MNVRDRITAFLHDLRDNDMLDHRERVWGFRPAVTISPEEEVELLRGVDVDLSTFARDGCLSYRGIRLFVRPDR